MADHQRRVASSTAPTSNPPIIPPAPPLPEPRRNAFTRFVTQPFTTYGSRPATAQTGREGGRTAPGNFPPRHPGYNPLTSQYAKFKTKVNAEVAALDINQERTHAILAGREVLETIKVHGTACSENLNIREALYSHDRHNATRHRDNLDIHDVKWSHGVFSNIIACAATNGKIVVYDLNRPGTEVAKLHLHTRQVHKLAFSPHQPALLLSASQDMKVMLWDLRDMRSNVASINARSIYSGQSDGIRDVRWSPADVLEFAFGTDTGVIQRWDHRSPKAPKVKINAYDGGCKSVDWHPDGKHLLSAGQDRASGDRYFGMLKVWDFSSDNKRQKPAWTIRTPYSVSNARWRPPCWSGDDHGRGSWQATQVVTSYEKQYPVAHVWDFRRPYIPFREVYTSKLAPTDLLWHSIDLLWSVGRDGDFYQTDVKYARKTIDRRPLSTFAISPTGELVAFGQKRSRRRLSDMEIALPGLANPSAKRVMFKSDIPELSRSSADDSIDDTFLSSSYQPRHMHHERSLSNRSTKSLSGTPPSLDKDTLTKLDETLDRKKEGFLPQQVPYRGPLEGVTNVQVFSYLAQKYKTESLPLKSTAADYKLVAKAFEQNAHYAVKTGKLRQATTWRMLGAVLENEIKRIAKQKHEQKRPDSAVFLESISALAKSSAALQSDAIVNSKSYLPSPAFIHGGKGTVVSESNSQMATPIARPQTQNSISTSNDSSTQKSLPDPSHEDSLSLPPSVVSVGYFSPRSVGISANRPQLSGSNTTGPSWLGNNDINDRRALIANWRAQPKALLDLDTPNKEATGPIPIPLDRHNSDESFSMFPSSSESKIGISPGQAIGSFRERKASMNSIPEHTAAYDNSTKDANSSPGYSQRLDNGSHSGSSKQSVFNGSFDSLKLAESPLGTKSYPLKMTHSSDVERGDSIDATDLANRLQLSASTAGSQIPTAATKSVDEVEPKSMIVDDFRKHIGSLNEHSYPITAGKLLSEAFKFYTTSVPDVQQIFHLTSLLKPFLPNSAALASNEGTSEAAIRISGIRQMLGEYNQYCKVELGLNDEEVYEILSSNLMHLCRFGIHPLQAEAIFTTYEEQLEKCQLFIPACQLRNLLHDMYGIYREDIGQACMIGKLCLKCNKSTVKATGRCEKCGERADLCPICCQKYSPFVVTKRARKAEEEKIQYIAFKVLEGGLVEEVALPHPLANSTARHDPVTTEHTETRADSLALPSTGRTPAPMPTPAALWQFCLTCGHGAHAACLQWYQKDPDIGGRCAIPECDCACIPGPYRDRMIREREREKEMARPLVRGEKRSVKESGAVKGARGLLKDEEREVEGGRQDGIRRVRLVVPERE